jgi:hypothetical protein
MRFLLLPGLPALKAAGHDVMHVAKDRPNERVILGWTRQQAGPGADDPRSRFRAATFASSGPGACGRALPPAALASLLAALPGDRNSDPDWVRVQSLPLRTVQP